MKQSISWVTLVMISSAIVHAASGPTGIIDGFNLGRLILARVASQLAWQSDGWWYDTKPVAVQNRFIPVANEVNLSDAQFVGAHNAYCCPPLWRCFYQHRFDIASQLQSGVRVFLLDTYLYQDTVVLSHRTPGSFYVMLQQGTLGSGRYEPLSDVLALIVRFLKDNPDEVIMISFENYAPLERLVQAIASVQELDTVVCKTSDWHMADSGHIWPTFSWMRNHSKRLFFFVPLHGYQDQLLWDFATYVVQNRCCTVNLEEQKQESDKSVRQHTIYQNTIGTDPRSLYFCNNFGRITRTFGQACVDNSYQRVDMLCKQCVLHERVWNACILDCVVEVASMQKQSGANDVFDLVNAANTRAAHAARAQHQQAEQ